MSFITCNNIKTYYERIGQGPALVMIHGLGNDSREWELLTGKLKDHFTLLTFDMRGSGKSDKPREPYSIELLADDTALFIEGVCKGPANVLGFSMGGSVAMDLAIRRPKLVERLILVSSFPSWNGPLAPSAHTKSLFRRTDVSPELLTAVYEIIFGSTYKKMVSAQQYIDFRLNEEYPQPLYAYLNQLHALEACDVSRSVSSIFAPTLIITGNEDQVVPPENSSWLKEKIPNSKLEIFEGAGHMIPIEMPERLAAKTLTWFL